MAGGGTFATGTFTEQGSGADIDGQNDAFHYVYQALTGDGELIARVTSVTNTDPWAKAGVMIRETLATNSKHAMMVLTPGNGANFQRRTATNSWNTGTSGGAAVAPLWVRIQRAGNVFTGYRSPDGVTWTQVGTDTFIMNPTVFVGLALTSHNNPVLGTATLTNVTVTGGGPVTTTTTTTTSTTTTTGPPGIVTITTVGLPAAAVSKAYTATLAASGGTPPYTWTIASGLPAGLTLNASTGVISGTPTAAGTFTFTAQVSAGAQNATRPLSITVAAAAPANAIAAENALAGNPSSQWDVTGAGDASIQGFGTDISVNKGDADQLQDQHRRHRLPTRHLPSRLLRRGGRRLDGHHTAVCGAAPEPAGVPVRSDHRPGRLRQLGRLGVVERAGDGDVGHLRRQAGARGSRGRRASHIAFIVRDDDGRSDMLFQTSDTTWQAYNTYGGNSLYNGLPAGRAYKVSYNRPYHDALLRVPGRRTAPGSSTPSTPWCAGSKRNGYDVSYSTGLDADRRGARDPRAPHLHDGGSGRVRVRRGAGGDRGGSCRRRQPGLLQRQRGASGRHGGRRASTARARPYRTLVCYKETHANAKIDPVAGRVDGHVARPALRPATTAAVRKTRSTAPSSWSTASRNDTPSGAGGRWQDALLAQHVDRDPGRGTGGHAANRHPRLRVGRGSRQRFRPAGLVVLSRARPSLQSRAAGLRLDLRPGTDTHHAVLHRHSRAARSCSTREPCSGRGDSTISTTERTGGRRTCDMQQATVNLLADMSVQPATLQAGLVAATKSTDITAPTAAITAPSGGFSLPTGTAVSVTGTASDVGGQVGAIEVSTDGGTTWHPANGRVAWTYSWTPAATGAATVRARAVDDSGNIGTPAQVSGTVTGVGQCGNGQVDAGEACDGGACCTSGCQFAASATVCRAAAGTCDQAETCSGSSAACPADALKTAGTVCRAAVGVCDVAETCSGSSTACPADGFASNGTACSDGVACTTDACSNGTCTGTPACPAGQTCNLTTGVCDAQAAATSIWSTSTVPTGAVAGSEPQVELGVKFRSDSAGIVTGIRFYKSALNTGTHIGNLWSSAGTLLATATFTGETGSGGSR